MNSILLLGMFAGLVAGLLSVVFARAFGEPQVARAIALEATLHPVADGRASEPVSRAVQGTLGLGVGGIVFAVAVGGIFAIAFAFVHGRFGRWNARATACVSDKLPCRLGASHEDPSPLLDGSYDSASCSRP